VRLRYAAMRWSARTTSFYRRLATSSARGPVAPLHPQIYSPPTSLVLPPPHCAGIQHPHSGQLSLRYESDGRKERGQNPGGGARFVVAGLLAWLGLTGRDEQPESQLVGTIKRGILAARVSQLMSLYFTPAPPLEAAFGGWWYLLNWLRKSDAVFRCFRRATWGELIRCSILHSEWQQTSVSFSYSFCTLTKLKTRRRRKHTRTYTKM
jgi:hypothetical protein